MAGNAVIPEFSWAWGELFDAGPNTLFTMLRSYMDESGLGKNLEEVLCCIAGLQCRNSRCPSLKEQWRLTLLEYKIDEFKAKQFWTVARDGGLSGKYKGWSFGKANAFISDLVRVVQRHECHILGAVVNLRDFFAYDADDRRFLTGATYHVKRQRFITSGKPSSAYFVALNAVLGQGLKLAAKDREECHFIFDEQEEYSSLAKNRIADMRVNLAGSGLEMFLGNAGYSPSHKEGALQAADLVAHVCKEYYRREMLGLPIEIDDSRGLLTPLEILTHLLTDDNFSFFRLGKLEMDAVLIGEEPPTAKPERQK